MTLTTFIRLARTNIRGIMFRTKEQVEAVNNHLRDAVTKDNVLYFGDAHATGVAIELAGLTTEDYCLIGETRRLPFVERYCNMDNPCVYAACLASYNNGSLHGMWIDATQDADDIQDDITYMLSYSNQEDAEEWAFHDYQNFQGLSIHEYESVEKISELANLIEEHGAAYVAYANNVGVDYATAEGFEESYCGEWESELDFATERFDETMEVPEHLASYIDYDAYCNDLFTDGFSSHSVNGGRAVYVFRDH